MHTFVQLSSVPPLHLTLLYSSASTVDERRPQHRPWSALALTMGSKIIMLIAWLALVCRALGSTIPSLLVGAVLLERASQLQPVYDYVIVGGGTSGLVVANRLSEDPKSTYVSRSSPIGKAGSS